MYIVFQCDNTLERGMHLLKEEEDSNIPYAPAYGVYISQLRYVTLDLEICFPTF